MKKKSDNSKYFLIGIVALIIIVILLDMRYTGYQIYTPPGSDYPGMMPSLPGVEGGAGCESGCKQLRDNSESYIFNGRNIEGLTPNEKYNLCVSGCPGGSTGFCGDGTRQSQPVGRAPEECDDGPWSPIEPGGPIVDRKGDGCYECKVERCGDRRPQPNEECDDGNNGNHDGCDSQCKTEPVEVCSRGEDQYDENGRLRTKYACGRPNPRLWMSMAAGGSGYPDGCREEILGAIQSNSLGSADINWLVQGLEEFYMEAPANDCARRTWTSSSIPGSAQYTNEPAGDNTCLCYRGMETCSVGDRSEGNACDESVYDNARCISTPLTPYNPDESIPVPPGYVVVNGGGAYCIFSSREFSRCACRERPRICGGQIYDPSTQECCGDETNGQIFDPSTQQCCDRGNQGQIDPLNPNTLSWPPRVCRSRPDEFCISASQNTITNVPECGECPDLEPNFNSAECERRYGEGYACTLFQCSQLIVGAADYNCNSPFSGSNACRTGPCQYPLYSGSSPTIRGAGRGMCAGTAGNCYCAPSNIA